MPNLDTHAALALHHNPDGGIEYAAGEVFDDAVRMAGGVPSHEAPLSTFSAGIRNNNALTDVAFDAQLPLRIAKSAMSAELEALEIPRGVRRGCVGPGTDILYSGVSLQRGDNVAYLEVCDFFMSAQGQRLVDLHTKESARSMASHQQILDNVQSIARHGLRSDYSDPAYVVERLRARAATRPRLEFPEGFESARLVDVFAAQQSRLAHSATEIYTGTLATITALPVSEIVERVGSPTMPIVSGVNAVVERRVGPITPRRIDDWQGILERELLAFNGNTIAGLERFTSSRAAAHFLLQNVARHSAEFTISQSGIQAPQFPEGWVGSISHSRDYAVAAIAPNTAHLGLGVDLEMRPTMGGRDRVLTEHERASGLVDGLLTRTLYSMKEAIFKAVHPLIAKEHPRKFWHKDAEITGMDDVRSVATVHMSATERGRHIAKLLGDLEISCHFIDKDEYSAAICTVD